MREGYPLESGSMEPASKITTIEQCHLGYSESKIMRFRSNILDGNLNNMESVCEGEEREINLIPFADVTAAQLFLGIIQTLHIFSILISRKLAGSQRN